jgi:23S rRNA pseudouridine2605 synthase
MLERLQKIISRAGIASRREAEVLIQNGRVSVNNVVIKELGAKADLEHDVIKVDNRPLSDEKKIYILLYKPKGIVTTLHDPEGRKTVTDLVKEIKERIYPVGRLDYNTEGLLLMTNDGELTNILTHPRHNIDKTYVAKVKGITCEEKLDLLRIGVKLSDGMTAPAKVIVKNYDYNKNSTSIEITIHEGKNRQVRRMFEVIGYPVNQLKRTKYAFLTLDGLKRGQYRYLESKEVEDLKKLV